MATSRSKIQDSVAGELNGEQVEVKGPDPDRLAEHKAQTRAFKESVGKVKGPAKDR